MMRMDSSWSGLPAAPNIIAPRQYGLTLIPVRPSVRYFMVLLVGWDDPLPRGMLGKRNVVPQ
jgi:hypothetical protein